MKKTLVLLLSVIMIFTSCTDSSTNAQGRLLLQINESASRSLESVSMETDHYVATITNAGGTSTYSIPKGQSSISLIVDAGSCTIKIDAKNIKDQTIGNAEKTTTILPGQDNIVNLTVNEIEGTGNLVVKVKSKADIGVLTARIVKGPITSTPSTSPEDFEMTYSAGEYNGSAQLKNGFYNVSIVNSTGKTIATPETFRIVAGYDVTYNLEITEKGKVIVNITNNIAATPSIDFTGLNQYYKQGETITASAVVSNMTPTSYAWYIDNEVIQQGASADLSFEILPEALTLGKHTLTCIASDSTKSWSESVEINVNTPIDKQTKMTVEGKVELAVIGDVLCPHGLYINLFENDIDTNAQMDCYTNKIVKQYNTPTTISFTLSDPDYEYYLVSEKQEDRTVVFIVIDKDIPNPAYIHFNFMHEFKLDDDEYMTLRFTGSSLTEDTYYGVPLSNWISERTMKVEPMRYDYYNYFKHNTSWVMRPEIDRNFYIAETGKTIEVNVSHDVFADVTLNLPGLEDGRKVQIEDGSGTDRIWEGTVKNEQVHFYAYPQEAHKLIALTVDSGNFGYYESEEIAINKGLNAPITLQKVSPNIVNTGININEGEKVLLQFNPTSIFSRYARMYAGTTQYQYVPVKKQNNTYYMTVEPGEFHILPLRYEGFEYSFSSSKTSEGVIITVDLHMPESKTVPVKINYDFAYSQEVHYNIYPIIKSTTTGQLWLIDLKNGRSTINMPADTYESVSSLFSERNMSNMKWSIVKENTFTVAPDQENSITITQTY